MPKADPRLDALHSAMIDTLLARVKDGSATASDMEVARKILKDNFIQNPDDEKAKQMGLLLDTLPDEDGAHHKSVYN